MKKPPTGEPYAGKPPVRFGGRGGESHPDPYPLSELVDRRNAAVALFLLSHKVANNRDENQLVGEAHFSARES
jgi:hypothetical protein